MSLLKGFVIGAANTGTAMRQQALAGDEDKLKTMTSGFGEAYKTFQEEENNFNAEMNNVRDVASALSVQDDEFLQNLNQQELEGVAQSLIQLSGAKDDPSKAIEFFLSKRDLLKGVPVPTTARTSADTQTDAIMQPAPEVKPADNRSFFQKIFSGKTDDEIADEVARKAGVSRERYNQIMSGFSGEMPEPSMLLAIGKEDPYKKIIKDNNTSVLTAIKTIKGTEEGAGLARNYLRAFAAYGAGEEGAMAPQQLLEMQNQILTTAAPPDAKAFLQPFDKIIDSVKIDKLDAETRKKALPLLQEIVGMKVQAIKDPMGFASNEENADIYSKKVFELSDMVNIKGDKDTFKVVKTMYDEVLKDAMANPSRFGVDSLQLLFDLEPTIRGDLNVETVDGVRNTITDILSKLEEKTDSPTDYDKRRENVINFLMSEQGGKLTRPEAELAATQQLDIDKVIMEQGRAYQIEIINGKKHLNPLPRISSRTGLVGGPGEKIESLNSDKLNKNNTSMMAIGETIVGLEVEPDAFNFVGDIMLRTSDGLDIVKANSLFPNVGRTAVNIQRMRQNTIPLIATAKDRLFEDPRLSDQDLAIVLNYVAVINDKTIGSTRAMAALINLQEALAQDNAMRMYQNNPSMKIVNRRDGRIDFSDTTTIAGQTMEHLAKSQGFKVLSKAEVDGLNDAEYDRYERQYERVAAMTARAMSRVEALRDLGGDTQAYRDTYKGQSNLMNISGTSATPDLFDNTVTIGTLQTELDAGRERVLLRDAAFYGNS